MDPFEKFYSFDEEVIEKVYNEFDNPEYKQISIISFPPEGKWKLPALYKIGARGEDRYYQIGFDGKDLVTIWGQVGGKPQTSRNEIELNSRSTSLADQAMIKAKHLFKEYYRQNYRPRGSVVPRIEEPMLGNPFNKAIRLTFPVALEKKLDGVRALFEMNDTEAVARSRGGKYYIQFEHICKYMKEYFAYLPVGTILDSEIYCHGFKLQDISGTARTINLEANLSKSLKAFVFDAVLPGNPYYEDRKEFIRTSFSQYLEDHHYLPGSIPIELVDYKLASSIEEIFDFHKKVTEEGYEGTVIKRTAAGSKDKSMCQYKGGKSNRFYKLKNIQTEEGIILEVLDCAGKEKGCARFTIIDPRGNIFTVRPEGSYDFRRKLYEQREDLVGQLFTYKMIGLTNHGLPNHPVGLAVRHDLDSENVIAKMRKDFALSGKCICDYITSECECDYWSSLPV